MKTIIVLSALLISFVVYGDIKVSGDKILISNDPKFERKLEIKSFEVTGKESVLSETGFIVSSAQSSFENDRFIGRWVSLDEQVLKQNHVDLSNVAPSRGMAYGIMSTSRDFASDLKVGQALKVKRYGLTGDHFEGKIIKLLEVAEKDIIQVHFLSSAPELIAGTTCEVEVPHIRKLPFKVSLLSLLHLGLEDYIVLKEGAGVYSPKHATIIDQDSETATILVPISKRTNYVARGAILLKPLLNKIIVEKAGRP